MAKLCILHLTKYHSRRQTPSKKSILTHPAGHLSLKASYGTTLRLEDHTPFLMRYMFELMLDFAKPWTLDLLKSQCECRSLCYRNMSPCMFIDQLERLSPKEPNGTVVDIVRWFCFVGFDLVGDIA